MMKDSFDRSSLSFVCLSLFLVPLSTHAYEIEGRRLSTNVRDQRDGFRDDPSAIASRVYQECLLYPFQKDAGSFESELLPLYQTKLEGGMIGSTPTIQGNSKNSRVYRDLFATLTCTDTMINATTLRKEEKEKAKRILLDYLKDIRVARLELSDPFIELTTEKVYKNCFWPLRKNAADFNRSAVMGQLQEQVHNFLEKGEKKTLGSLESSNTDVDPALAAANVFSCAEKQFPAEVSHRQRKRLFRNLEAELEKPEIISLSTETPIGVRTQDTNSALTTPQSPKASNPTGRSQP